MSLPTVPDHSNILAETRLDSGKDLGARPSGPFRPRVLFVSSSSANGGADRHPVELAAQLQARGASVWFACKDDQFIARSCTDARVETTPFDITNSGDLIAARRLAKLIVRRSIDVVHAHARRDFVTVALANLFARPQRRLLGAPPPRLVFHVHLIRKLGTPDGLSGRFFQASADAVIAVSGVVESYLRATHHLRPDFLRLIHNGVELDRYETPETVQAQIWRNGLRREWNIPEDVPVIGMVGRLRQKGQADLLDAAPDILRRFPDARFVLVGPARHVGDVARFEERATALGIADRVIVTGVRDDIPAVMAAFDVLVHLPADEAFGLALVEAMASGIPTVASDIGGCREVIRHGETGILVAQGSRNALVTALCDLLDPAHGPSRRAAMGAEARRSAHCFSRTRQLERIEELYSDLCVAAL